MRGRKVVVVGMGAFAVETVRSALERGAAQVVVVGLRHGTVSPRVVDYFTHQRVLHDRLDDAHIMAEWKAVYEAAGGTPPPCCSPPRRARSCPCCPLCCACY